MTNEEDRDELIEFVPPKEPEPVQVDRTAVALEALDRLWDENNLTRAYEERRADLDYIKAVINGKE